MSKFSTGEVAKICGISVRAVQFYDEKGLLSPSELTEGGRRLYNDKDVEKLKVICFLRELGFSVKNVKKILKVEESKKVISVLLAREIKDLESEISEKQRALNVIKELQKSVDESDEITLKIIEDVAKKMEKKKLRNFRIKFFGLALFIELLQVSAVIVWAKLGVYIPFIAITAMELFYAVILSRLYYKKISYICPECKKVFKPTFWKVFWASHTPNTRKLVCTHCSFKGYCVETYDSSSDKKKEDNKEQEKTAE